LEIPKLQVAEGAAFASVFFNRGDCAAVTLLNQTTRLTVFNFVKENPGLHFRAIADCLNMPIGVLQYHLGLLVKGDLVSAYPNGRYKRYFESHKFTEVEMKVISALRHKTPSMILIALLRKPQMSHKDLAEQMDISSQALSWQMREMEKMNLVRRNIEGLSVKYSLDEAIRTTVNEYSKLSNGAAGSV